MIEMVVDVCICAVGVAALGVFLGEMLSPRHRRVPRGARRHWGSRR